MSLVLENRKTGPAVEKPRRKGINWLAVVAWQVIAILFVEFTLFCAGLGEEETVKIDPELGSVHLTNKRVTWRSEGHSVSWFDANGMRESGLTVAKPANTYRIALLGDSMTESLQVNLEKTFGKKLEGLLKGDLGRDVQVLNFGCSGYSTVQELLLLRRKVLPFKPDLVLVFYNNRDSFENWSPPDQVIANVRPMAMHLPGGNLVIDSSPVKAWMKSPRAKFLKQFEWLRSNSRIWGFAAAVELDWSLHNDTYRGFVYFLTRPGKAVKQWREQLATQVKDLPALASKQMNGLLGAISGTSARPAIDTTAAAATEKASGVNNAAAGATVTPSSGPTIALTRAERVKKLRGSSAYIELVYKTLGSILDQMRDESAAAGAHFGVVAMPVRSALVLEEGAPQPKNDFDYKAEVDMLEDICTAQRIPYLDCNRKAESLSADDRKYMFYAVHLTPEGHDFVAKSLHPFLKDLSGQSVAN